MTFNYFSLFTITLTSDYSSWCKKNSWHSLEAALVKVVKDLPLVLNLFYITLTDKYSSCIHSCIFSNINPYHNHEAALVKVVNYLPLIFNQGCALLVLLDLFQDHRYHNILLDRLDICVGIKVKAHSGFKS